MVALLPEIFASTGFLPGHRACCAGGECGGRKVEPSTEVCSVCVAPDLSPLAWPSALSSSRRCEGLHRALLPSLPHVPGPCCSFMSPGRGRFDTGTQSLPTAADKSVKCKEGGGTTFEVCKKHDFDTSFSSLLGVPGIMLRATASLLYKEGCISVPKVCVLNV